MGCEMKRTYVYLLLICLGIVMIMFVVYSYYPKEVLINTQGIKYRLGNVEYEQSIHVLIKGKMYKSFSGNRTFRGVIELEGEEVPVPQSQRQLELHFYKEYQAVLIYPYFENGKIYHHLVGTLYLDRDFTKATIALLEKKDNQQGSWDGTNGLMVTAPASNRREAIEISNELMNEYIDGFRLK